MIAAVDLFAGPGGFGEGVLPLGLKPLGIEWDDAACATREAAGHRTLQGDVAALDPAAFAPCEFLLGSPPCPTFSAAGAGAGRRDMGLIVECAEALVNGRDERVATLEQLEDGRSLLVVEPLRWALALQPRWIALEQVPPVLELWQLYATWLRGLGWHCWAGVLSAERYGVPQTRRRAFLMADRERPVSPPLPTHQAYEPGVPAREEHTLEGTLEPWVSMAEALGWGMTGRPGLTFLGGNAGGPDLAGGSGARNTLKREREREDGSRNDGRWLVGFPRRADDGAVAVIDGEDYRQRDLFDACEPAPALTEKARSWRRYYDRRQGNTLPGGGTEDGSPHS